MTHCENCPRPGIKDMYDDADTSRQKKMLSQFEGVSELCALGELGCPAIFRNALNDLAEEGGKGRPYTDEGIRRKENRLRNFDQEY